MNDSNIISFNRLEEPPAKSYFYPNGVTQDSMKIKTWVTIDTSTKQSIPFDKLSALDSAVHVSGTLYQKKKSVVVYSYISCKPCAELKSKLQEEINNGKLESSLVVVLNPIDDIEHLKRFITHKSYSFSYYRTQQKIFGDSFPKICGYDENGNL